MGGERPKGLDLASRSRKVADLPCCLLFLIYWVGMLIVAVIGLATGDVQRLLFASDYLGNTCGTCKDGNSCGINIYYPRPSFDALLQGFNPLTGAFENSTTASSASYYGICVDSCPSYGDFVCTYDVQQQLDSLYPSPGEQALFLDNCVNQMQALNRGPSNNYGLDAFDPSNTCRTYMDSCYFVTENYANLFWRCMPVTTLNTTSSFSCHYPEYQDIQETVRMPATVCPDQLGQSQLDPECIDSECLARTGKSCVPNDRCQSVMERETNYNVQTGPVSPGTLLATQLGSWTHTLSRDFGELKYTWWTILITGVIGSFVIGYLWLFVLEAFVGVFVYLVIFLSLLLQLVLILLCFAKAGKLSKEVTWLSGQTGLSEINATFSPTQSQQTLWFFLGILFSVIGILYLIMIIAMWRKIKLSTRVLREASIALRSIKSIFILPLTTSLALFIAGVYGIGIFGYLFTADSNVSKTLSIQNLGTGALNDLSGLAADQVGRRRFLGANIKSESGAAHASEVDVMWPNYPLNVEIADFGQAALRLRMLAEFNMSSSMDISFISTVATTGTSAMIFYHIFGVFWMFQVIIGVNLCSISRSVSRWYWRKEDEKGDLIPLWGCLRHTLRYNFGSICFGAAVIAIIKLIRIVVQYFKKYLGPAEERNSFIKVIGWVISSCLYLFENFLKYITSLAYIMIAMEDTSFLAAASDAWKLLTNNLARLATTHFINKLITWLSILVITAVAVILEIVWLDNDPEFQYGGLSAIQSSTVTVVCTGVVAFYISCCFMEVYDVAVETILLCFCKDRELNDKTGDYYMSKRLKKNVFAKKRKKNKNRKGSKEDVAAAGGAKVNPV